MMKEVVAEYQRNLVEFSSILNNNTNIIPISPSSTQTQLKTDLQALYPNSVIHSQIICQSIDVRASINSLPQFKNPPSTYDATATQIQRSEDLLTELWKQPRREIELRQQLNLSAWIFRGSLALPNRIKSGAFYYDQMLSILTDFDDYPIAATEKLGIALVQNSFGVIDTGDKIAVVSSWELRHNIFTN